MKTSLQLATQKATKMAWDIQNGDTLDSRFLEQCISLVDGNILVILTLMRAYKTSFNSFKLLYRNLTDVSVLTGYGQDDVKEIVVEDLSMHVVSPDSIQGLSSPTCV